MIVAVNSLLLALPGGSLLGLLIEPNGLLNMPLAVPNGLLELPNTPLMVPTYVTVAVIESPGETVAETDDVPVGFVAVIISYIPAG